MERPDVGAEVNGGAMDAKADKQETLPEIQREVQRKFGRAVLLLQQYERLAKALVAEQSVAGPIDKLAEIKASRAESISKKTLGQVVGEFTDGYLRTLDEGPDGDSEEEPSSQNLPWFRVSFSSGIPATDFERTVGNLAELVALRNDLVHHFLEKYDIGTDTGCQVAASYLQNCTKQVELRLEELRSWARSANEVRQRVAALCRSPEFEEFIVHGILPGGAGVNWASCTIVELLRDAEKAHTRNGWTLLQDAIDFSRKTEPDHGPSRYGCRSWRQVVHESREFEIRKGQLKAGEPRDIWYRSKPASA